MATKIDHSNNFAYNLLWTTLQAQTEWLNQLEEARAFILAADGTVQAKDDELYQRVSNNVNDLRQSLLVLLQASPEDFGWTGDL